jgi:hypothetical protein
LKVLISALTTLPVFLSPLDWDVKKILLGLIKINFFGQNYPINTLSGSLN